MQTYNSRQPQNFNHGDLNSHRKITSHASASIITRIEGRFVFFLVFNYTMQEPGMPDFTTWRFPVESMAENVTRESPTLTMKRGICEEVVRQRTVKGSDGVEQKVPVPFHFEFMESSTALARLGPCKRSADGLHLKLFRLAELKYGELRTEMLYEDGVRDGEKTVEIVGPPEWREASEVLQLMSRSPLTHREAVITGLWKLTNRERGLRAVEEQYSEIVQKAYTELITWKLEMRKRSPYNPTFNRFFKTEPEPWYPEEAEKIVAYIKSFKD